jgi:hypothetical protein
MKPRIRATNDARRGVEQSSIGRLDRGGIDADVVQSPLVARLQGGWVRAVVGSTERTS